MLKMKSVELLAKNLNYLTKNNFFKLKHDTIKPKKK